MKSGMSFVVRTGMRTALRHSVAANPSGTIFRQSQQQLPKLWAAARKNYSTKLSKAEETLVEKLNEEIKAETEMAQQDFKDSSFPDFKVTHEEAEVKLVKEYNGQTITISFNVNHSVDQDQGAEEGGQNEEAASESMSSRPNFSVEILNENQQKLVFECQQNAEEEDPEGQGNSFAIDEVYLYSGELSDKVYACSGAVIDMTLYDNLMLYLGERGVNGEFVSNMTKFATHYEHAQYVALLKKLKAFVSN